MSLCGMQCVTSGLLLARLDLTSLCATETTHHVQQRQAVMLEHGIFQPESLSHGKCGAHLCDAAIIQMLSVLGTGHSCQIKRCQHGWQLLLPCKQH